MPPILLEGDHPPAPKVTGPGARYALAPAPVAARAEVATARTQLPDSYGTGRMFLAARDPRWLYASWDLTSEQQMFYNQQARDGHLILRVFAGEPESKLPEIHVNPESRTWFISVPRAETRYRAQLGFYDRSGTWETVTHSHSTFTPPDAPAPEAAVEFATIPAQVTFQQVVETVQEFVSEHRPLLEAVIIAQEAKRPEPERTEVHFDPPSQPGREVSPRPEEKGPSPEVPPAPRRSKHPAAAEIPVRVEKAAPWSPERKTALAELIHIDSYRRVWMGSIEITELVRRQLQEEVSSIAAAELARAAAEGRIGIPEFGISSPAIMAAPPARNFWFKVNAELIIYGATEPDAQVTIADRAVKLRPDGTFSFRFALPDGRYDLPATARSADGVESRSAILEFSRSTDYHGHVDHHPQDPGLKTPRAENI